MIFCFFIYNIVNKFFYFFFFSSRRRHTIFDCDWSSDVCSSDLEKYKYPNYFQIQPSGPDPEANWATGFFEIAARQNPKPQTIALVGADAEYPRHAIAGARELVKKFGFQTVYDKSNQPITADYTPSA